MTEQVKNQAINLIQSNLNYLDEVIEAAIVNLLEDENLDVDDEFIAELQQLYEAYLGEEKYGRKNT